MVSKQNLRYIVLSISALGGVLAFIAWWHFTADDAYIIFRHAKNLVSHGKWAYNPTGDAEVAVTGLLWPALMVFPEYIGIDTAFFAKCLGVIIVFGWLVAVYNKRWGVPSLILLNLGIYIHGLSGLETMLFAVCAFFLYGAAFKDQKQMVWLAPILVLVRPEGFVIALICSAVCLSENKKEAINTFITASVAFAGYLLFNYFITGQALPNSYYFKVYQDVSFKHIVANILNARIFILVAGILWILTEHFKIRVFLISVTLYYIILYAPSNLAMNYLYRFEWQLFFPLFIFVLLHMNKLRFKYAVSIILLLNVFILEPSRLKKIYNYGYGMDNYVHVGNELSQIGNENYVLYTGEAGSIPYYSGWNTVDYLGLGTRFKEQDFKLVLDKNEPELALLYSSKADTSGLKNYMGHQAELLSYIKKSDYQIGKAVKFRKNYYLIPFVKSDNPNSEMILELFNDLD